MEIETSKLQRRISQISGILFSSYHLNAMYTAVLLRSQIFESCQISIEYMAFGW